ncbi:para-aminobenzoate synthase, (PABA) [Coemansia sp. S142-1]|nr:para-aminobenzoate synthase, (PABA) [Coemansia sp. S142-1]
MPAATPLKFATGGDIQPLRTLLVDNYDSYTLNLLQLLVQQLPEGASVLDSIIVIRNDQYSWDTVRDCILPHIDSIVISPGPGNPERKADFGVCGDLIHHAHATGMPVLGVCLGHQGIAAAFGGRVRQCEVPVHGQTSPVELIKDVISVDGEPGLFDKVPDLFKVVRYHSLAVSEEPGEFPAELQVLARAAGTVRAMDPETGRMSEVESREIMALRHRTRPIFGVQFHPESICSEHGARIIQNFGAIARRRSKQPRSKITLPRDVAALSLLAQDNRMWRHDVRSSSSVVAHGLRLVYEAVDLSEYAGADVGGDLFAHLYGDDTAPIWLDSASNSGMSVMASAQTPGSITVRYSVQDRQVTIVRLTGDNSSSELFEQKLDNAATFWTWMQGVVDRTQIIGSSIDNAGLGFQCGWVGYFGYEMKHAEKVLGSAPSSTTMAVDPDRRNNEDRLPDAQLTFVDRCVVVDHKHKPPQAYVLALVAVSDVLLYSSPPAWIGTLGFRRHDEAADWISRQAESIRSWMSHHCTRVTPPLVACNNRNIAVSMEPDLSCAEYVDAIARAKQWIAQGESYEICLTTQFRLSLDHHSAAIRSAQDMYLLYASMRKHNPAPYGALLWMGDISSGIASCSPERFLRTYRSENNERWVEMKPIKGTCRRMSWPTADREKQEEWKRDDEQRASQLQNDVKERAENLMIVDLIRHDLNWIAHNANVQVPSLMAIESYASVHQMVTTVQAQLRSSVGAVGALAHCFPPGSMTGAPKLRTVRLLEDLESTGRGVYSGCLGYFSAHGQADWSVVIRTAVVDRGGKCLSVGAGGALTILSDPSAEWAEVETKLHSVLPGISQYVTSSRYY